MFQGCFVDFRFGFRFSVHLRVRALWVIFAGMYIYIYIHIHWLSKRWSEHSCLNFKVNTLRKCFMYPKTKTI